MHKESWLTIPSPEGNKSKPLWGKNSTEHPESVHIHMNQIWCDFCWQKLGFYVQTSSIGVWTKMSTGIVSKICHSMLLKATESWQWLTVIFIFFLDFKEYASLGTQFLLKYLRIYWEYVFFLKCYLHGSLTSIFFPKTIWCMIKKSSIHYHTVLTKKPRVSWTYYLFCSSA